MRPLRYSINVTLDGCSDHGAGIPDAELHRYAAEMLAKADALIFGRVVYEMMEQAWRPLARGENPHGMPEWTMPFAKSIDAAKKYVVSDTLAQVDWNAELVRGHELEATVRKLKQQPGAGLYTGGVTLPLALTEMGLIDEYELWVQPRIVGHGPSLFAGLSTPLDLRLVGRSEFASGVQVLKYEPKR
jgi:dihydrofolate reductase